MIPHEHNLLQRLLHHEDCYWTTVSQAEARGGWTLFHNPMLPTRYDPNHAGAFHAPDADAAAIVAEVIAFYTTRGLVPVAYVDRLSQPADLAAQLEAAGFRNMSTAEAFGVADLLLYVGPDAGQPAEHAVQIAQTAADREAWASIMDESAADPAQRELFRRLHLAEISDARVVAYLSLMDGIPAARCLSFSQNGITRIETVRTALPYRGRGLAATVVRRAAVDALARGDLVHLYAEQGGDAQRLYERLGFRTIARDVVRSYVYQQPPSEHPA